MSLGFCSEIRKAGMDVLRRLESVYKKGMEELWGGILLEIGQMVDRENCVRTWVFREPRVGAARWVEWSRIRTWLLGNQVGTPGNE